MTREELENLIHHHISGHMHPETARQTAQRLAVLIGGAAQKAQEPDLERFCIAFSWAYGTALERRHYPNEPDDGHTPQSLWEAAPEEEREFIRGVIRETFNKAISPQREAKP